MTFAVIVQARAGSTRLPKKVFEDLGGKPALIRCLDRCARIEGATVVCAVSESPDSDGVAVLAERHGYKAVRGSDQDVLSRTAKAAREVDAQTVMRITSDCPLIDPAIAKAVVALLHKTKADYACNNMPPSWPHGLDCEVFPAALLYEADSRAKATDEREHVTPWIRRNLDFKRAGLTGPGGMMARLRWTLDYPEDLTFFRALYATMGETAATASAAEIASLCLRRPDLVGINAHKVDEARLGANMRPTIATPKRGLDIAA